MSQSLTLTPGSSYKVSFWVRAATASVSGTFSLSVGGVNIFSLTNLPTSYTHKSAIFVAGSSSATLQIQATTVVSSGGGIRFDDIAISETTETNPPTGQPTGQPTRQPTRQPTGQPTRQPTSQPTKQPVSHPTAQPSSNPTQPTGQPSAQPTGKPTDLPSSDPSAQPSAQPSGKPIAAAKPSGQPTSVPSAQPTSQPTNQPTEQPSAQPTQQPTSQPTLQPSAQPTSQPTSQPSAQPTEQPTEQLTSQPTEQPSTQPTEQPTSQPSTQPTEQPTEQPTSQPSAQPSLRPSAQPSAKPSAPFVAKPTGQPTRQPSAQPTRQPSSQPSAQPTKQPTAQPTRVPTMQPSAQPTTEPTSEPTTPTGQPTSNPTQPTGQPTSTPTILPKELSNSVDSSALTHYQGLSVNGKVAYDGSGSAITGLKDIDGDGHDDFATGAPNASPLGRTNAGSVTIVHGSDGRVVPTSINIADTTYRITQIYGAYGAHSTYAGDQCGIVLSSAGDFNGDGYYDIMISCYLASRNGSPNNGAVYIVYGGPNLDSIIDLLYLTKAQGFAMYGANSYDLFGFAVIAMHNYIFMSAPQASPEEQTNAGIVYRLKGNDNQTNTDLSITPNALTQMYGSSAGDFFGSSLGEGGDFQKNGGYYLVAGAPYASDGDLTKSGTAYLINLNFTDTILYLKNAIPPQVVRIFGKDKGGLSSYAATSVGDYDNNGRLDLAIGTPFSDPFGRVDAGTITVILEFNLTANIYLSEVNNSAIEIYGGKAGHNLGKILKPARDLNNDGCFDLMYSIPTYSYLSKYQCGIVYTLLGALNPISIDMANFKPNLVLSTVGGKSLDALGSDIAPIDDFNGDGYPDSAAGAPGASPDSHTKAGSTKVLYGGYTAPTGQPTAQPSTQPTEQPTSQPTKQPTVQPTTQPSMQPSAQPTRQPTGQPSSKPSAQPTSMPSPAPTKKHSKKPTAKPIIYPTSQPSGQPTGQPTRQPSAQPTRQPVLTPTGQPTGQPTNKPTARPTYSPTSPTGQPTSKPTMRPTGQPSSAPTSPTSQPTSVPTIVEKKLADSIDLKSLTHAQGVTANGRVSYDASGSAIAVLDFDGDGFDDAAIGAANSNGKAGSITIVFGSYGHNTPDSINLANTDYRTRLIYSSNAGDQCGIKLAKAGDLNKDGISDLLISCYLADYNSLAEAGALYAVYGSTSLTSLNLQNMTIEEGFAVYGDNEYGQFSSSLAGVGDIDGDGRDDIAAGSPSASPNGQTNAGSLYAIKITENQGNIDLASPPSNVVKINGANAGDYFSYAVAGGDFFGLGHHSLAVSAIYGSDNYLSGSGNTYIFSLNFSSSVINMAELTANQYTEICGKTAGEASGSSLMAGDFDGSGKLSLAIGAPLATFGGRTQAGRISVIPNKYLKSNINLANFNGTVKEIAGAKDGDKAGSIMANSGRVDKTNYEGLILGFPQNSYKTRTKCGEVINIYGSESFASVDLASFSAYQGTIFAGANSLDAAGTAVGGKGDFNGDGVMDFFFCAPGASPLSNTKSGSCYTIYGGYNSPTGQPTSKPSNFPSQVPTAAPSGQPNAVPTANPAVFKNVANSHTKKNMLASIVGVSGAAVAIGIAMCVFQSILYDLGKAIVIKLVTMDWKEAIKATPGVLYRLGESIVVKAITTDWLGIAKATPRVIYKAGKQVVIKIITIDWLAMAKAAPGALYGFGGNFIKGAKAIPTLLIKAFNKLIGKKSIKISAEKDIEQGTDSTGSREGTPTSDESKPDGREKGISGHLHKDGDKFYFIPDDLNKLSTVVRSSSSLASVIPFPTTTQLETRDTNLEEGNAFMNAINQAAPGTITTPPSSGQVTDAEASPQLAPSSSNSWYNRAYSFVFGSRNSSAQVTPEPTQQEAKSVTIQRPTKIMPAHLKSFDASEEEADLTQLNNAISDASSSMRPDSKDSDTEEENKAYVLDVKDLNLGQNDVNSQDDGVIADETEDADSIYAQSQSGPYSEAYYNDDGSDGDSVVSQESAGEIRGAEEVIDGSQSIAGSITNYYADTL